MIITIDGPVASGKSSVSQLLAERLGFYHVNTGLLYRAVAYAMEYDFGACPQGFSLAEITNISYVFENGKPVVRFRGHVITPFLKESRFDQASSLVSADPMVRQALLDVQRTMGKQFNIIADGRDCGSVVYPDADYKFYLTAAIEVRTVRMATFLQQKTGQVQDLSAVRNSIVERDKRDSERDVAPLRVPERAIVIDNGQMTIEQTVELMVSYVKKSKTARGPE